MVRSRRPTNRGERGSVCGGVSAKFGPRTFMDRRSSSCIAGGTKKQPGRPILRPSLGAKQIATKQSPVKQSAVDRPQTVPARLPFFPLAAVAADNVRVPGNLAPSGSLSFTYKCHLGGIARAAASPEKRVPFAHGWARGPGQRFRNTAHSAVFRNTPRTEHRSTSGVPGIGRIHYTGRIIKQPSVLEDQAGCRPCAGEAGPLEPL